MRPARHAALLALAFLIFALPTNSSAGTGTVPSKLGNEVLRLEPIHFHVINAAMVKLEPMTFPPLPFDISNGSYEIVLLQNDDFYSVLFLDKARIKDCDNQGVPLCFVSSGTPGLLEFAVTVSKDASHIFGWELVNTAEYRPTE